MPRPRIHQDAAARQRAYRRRMAEREREVLPQTVRAPFRVVDDDGRMLLEVAATEDGARLTLCNAAGRVRLIVLGGDAGGALVLGNSDARRRVLLAVSDAGGFLQLFDSDGNLVVNVPKRQPDR